MTNKEISEYDIINFLKADSGFYIRHPELLQDLQVSTKNGSVTSLANHQINVLKERNDYLKRKLSDLIKHAENNEKLVSQVFELSLQLCQISHVANVTKHFGRFVKQSFKSDLFRLVIPQYENLESSPSVLCVENESEFISLFSDFIQNDSAVCGRLKKDKLKYIFAQKASKIGSSVMLPIGKKANKGILVFASYDETRFYPDMSTDILAKLAAIMDSKLKNSFDLTDGSQMSESE